MAYDIHYSPNNSLTLRIQRHKHRQISEQHRVEERIEQRAGIDHREQEESKSGQVRSDFQPNIYSPQFLQGCNEERDNNVR